MGKEPKEIEINIDFGCGYSEHSTSIFVQNNYSEEEIEEAVREKVMENFWWTHEPIDK